MPTTALISVLCQDCVGLVSAIAGRLYDLGTNLGDTTFAVLGGAAEFTAVCELPPEITIEDVDAELRSLPELAKAEITVSPFELSPIHGPSGHITHRIQLKGGDHPGLIARLCEVFIQFGANIVRLNSEKIPGPKGDEYVVRIAVWIPPENSRSCLATISNTAGELRLECSWKEA